MLNTVYFEYDTYNNVFEAYFTEDNKEQVVIKELSYNLVFEIDADLITAYFYYNFKKMSARVAINKFIEKHKKK